MLATLALGTLSVLMTFVTVFVFIFSTTGDMMQLFARPPAWKTSLVLSFITLWLWLAFLGY